MGISSHVLRPLSTRITGQAHRSIIASSSQTSALSQNNAEHFRRALHTGLRTPEDPSGIRHVKTDTSTTDSTSRGELLARLGVLRLMRIKPLHGLAVKMLDANPKTLLGSASIVLMKPFVNQFCAEGSVQDVVAQAQSKSSDTRYMIFDFAEEMINDPRKAPHTAEQYHAYLNHPNVHMIAVKITGLCRPEILEQGDPTHPEIEAAGKMLMEFGKSAQKLGKTIFIDAEHYAAEKANVALSSPVMEKFQGHVYLTFQATRKDSAERIQQIVNALPAGKKLYFKLVKGAYNADRTAYPEAFHQTFSGTHKNYVQLLKDCANNPKTEVLPCTHNPTLIQLANDLGIKWVGNLSGMEVTDKSILYFIGHHDAKALNDYMKRRFDEHKDALEPRAENFVRQKLGLPKTCTS